MNLEDVIFKSCGKIAEGIAEGITDVRLKLVKLKLVKQTGCA